MIRLLTILLLFIHTLTQAGTLLSVHYCMGDLAGVTWGEEKHPGCSFCGMKSKSCCHDDNIVIKSDELVFTTSIIKVDPQIALLTLISNKIKVYGHNSAYKYGLTGFKFLSSGGPPIYLKNSVFRI